jgi:hypothetical protein
MQSNPEGVAASFACTYVKRERKARSRLDARVALREYEHPHARAETILSKLSELIFLQAVRQYIDGHSCNLRDGLQTCATVTWARHCA